MPQRQRADARRNYARILDVAEQEVAAHGVDASLEQIARTAGVGSATVRRHFPSRQALLEAVSRERVEALRVRAIALTEEPDSRAALLEWLGELVDYCVSARGLAAALSYADPTPEDGAGGRDPVHANHCSATMEEAVGPLLSRAIEDGTVSADVTASELIILIVGIALATEHTADPAARARRLFRVAVAGLSPQT